MNPRVTKSKIKPSPLLYFSQAMHIAPIGIEIWPNSAKFHLFKIIPKPNFLVKGIHKPRKPLRKALVLF